MKRSKPLARRTPLKTAAPLERKTPIAKRNSRRLRKLRAEQFADQSALCRVLPCCFCQPFRFSDACNRILDGQAVPEYRVSDPHHVKTRGAGGKDEHTIPACRDCHMQLDSPGNSARSFAAQCRVNVDEVLDTMKKMLAVLRAGGETNARQDR